MIKRVALLALILTCLPAASYAQTLSGTITGTVTDAQGAVLPGVNVTLTGRTGSQATVSDESGVFRFVGLNPGPYSIRAELSGFRTYEEQNLDLGIGRTITLRVGMLLGTVAETVEVVATSPIVDTTSTATDTTISQDLLFSMPISRTNAAVNMLNNAPGVNSGSAFGGPANAGNALLLDGVDTSDPEAGTAWTFFNYNIIDEVQVGSLGQPAEYGGFTGAVVNTITKSGGNRYSSLFEYRYTEKGLRGDNITDEIKTQNPTLAASGVDKLNDYTVQLGGPIRRDKVFFFGSIQRYSIEQDPDGPRTIRTEVSPRFNTKVTFQPSAADSIIGTFQYDQYNQTGRTGLGGAALTTDERTIEQDSPEFIWNGQYRKVLGSSSFFEAKFTGYWGYFDLDPILQESARLNDDGSWSGGAGYSAKYDRLRNQLNASFSRYVEAKGTHNFKFGMEIERSTTRNRYAYTDDVQYYDIGGEPYLAYSYSYDVEGTNKRNSFYAQDQWTIGRVTANLGVRFDFLGGDGANGVEYYSTTGIGPRLGLAFDVTGRGTSVLRAFYGHLYSGAVFTSWSRAVPGISDYVIYEVSPTGVLSEIDRVPAENKFTVDPEIDHPRTDEFNVAFEQQLFGRTKLTATYIRRDSKNFINSVLVDGLWGPTTVNNAKTGQPLTIYEWANANPATQRFSIRNVDDATFVGANGQPIGSADPTREYNGLMLVLTRPIENRWQAQLSYVLSKTEGRVTSGATAGVSSGQFETPNTILINRDGLVPLDRRHEFKGFVGYQVPWIEVGLNAVYRGTSGVTYTPFTRYASGTIDWTSSVDVQIEPQGTYRVDPLHIVDLRLEKVFRAGFNRFGVYADFENLFNVGTAITAQNRYPSAAISGNTVLFGSATAVTSARQATFGARWSF
jgi:Carboxypeptidase regulatory-like domain